MDPLSAFSLACGIIQVIDFSARVLSTAKEVYEEGSPKAIKELTDQTSHMDRMASDLRREQSARIADPNSVGNNKEILSLAIKCGKTTEELLGQLNKMQMSGPQSLLRAVGKSLKMKSRIKKIEKLSKDLDSCHNLLDTRYLMDLRAKLDRATIEQEASFKRLDQSHQAMAIAFAEGATSCKNLAQVIENNVGEQFQRRQQEEQRKAYEKDFLGGLFFPEITQRERGIQRAHEETFRWLYEKDMPSSCNRAFPNFAEWLKSGSKIYWISGKPGSGKSTLMSYLVRNPQTTELLESWAGDKRLLTPSFFFWAAGTLLMKTLAGFFRSLIFQILVKYPDLIQIKSKQTLAFPGYSQALTVWTEEDLREYFLGLLKTMSNSFRICLFIDGLDECSKDQRELVRLLKELVNNPNIKCCVSSRPERPFEHLTGSMLRLQDLNKRDIRNYVEAKLDNIPQVQILSAESLSIKEKLKEIIIKKADGVFLWVELAVKSQINGLANNDSIDLLEKRLESLPSELNDLYHQTLMRIDAVYREEAAWYLGMVSNFDDLANRPTTGLLWFFQLPTVYSLALVKHGLTETLHLSRNFESRNIASECSRMSETIPTYCAGLLEMHDEYHSTRIERDFLESCHPRLGRWTYPVVRFIHRSAKEFLNDESSGGAFLRSYGTFPKRTDLLPSAICLAQMKMCNLEDCKDYMRYHANLLMHCASEASPNSQDEITRSVELLKYFDEAIQDLYDQKSGSSNSNHWCQGWCDVLEYGILDFEQSPVQKSYPIPFEYSPSDLDSLAAWHGVEWFLLEELRECSLSTERANQLAFCATVDKQSFHVKRPKGSWYIAASRSLGTIRVLKRLVELGGNGSIGLSSSIWEQVLLATYWIKFSDRPWYWCDMDDFNIIIPQVFETFFKNGANPSQIIFKPLGGRGDQSIFDRLGLAGFEIDISRLPVIHTLPKMLDTASKAQLTDESEGPREQRRSLRLWLREPRDSITMSYSADPHNYREYLLSEAQESQFYGFLRQILDYQHESQADAVERLETWLGESRYNFTEIEPQTENHQSEDACADDTSETIQISTFISNIRQDAALTIPLD